MCHLPTIPVWQWFISGSKHLTAHSLVFLNLHLRQRGRSLSFVRVLLGVLSSTGSDWVFGSGWSSGVRRQNRTGGFFIALGRAVHFFQWSTSHHGFQVRVVSTWIPFSHAFHFSTEAFLSTRSEGAFIFLVTAISRDSNEPAADTMSCAVIDST
jgi:hypothetical protein